jgi:hypothetical protein
MLRYNPSVVLAKRIAGLDGLIARADTVVSDSRPMLLLVQLAPLSTLFKTPSAVKPT